MPESVHTTAPGNEVAVIGMACRFPGAADLESFWANLRNGVESIHFFSEAELIAAGEDLKRLAHPKYVRAAGILPDIDHFDAGFFGMSPRDAAIMDPQHRLFLECVWHALEHAGCDPERYSGAIGVYAGSGLPAYMMHHLTRHPDLMASVGEWLLRHTGNDKDFLATRASYEFDLQGPSINVQTACSTSLVAIHLACQGLLNGECDMALAGGVNIVVPHQRGYVHAPGEILSADGHCRAFDAQATGTVFGSGVGIVALKLLADAVADGDTIYAVIKGSAINNDGSRKVGYMAPSVDRQADVIAEALEISGVDPDTVTYVETHGTGTPVGDPIEMTALTQAFQRWTQRKQFCAIGSVKTNLGHLGEAAGVAGFIKTVLALRARQLPPSLNFRQPNPQIDFGDSPFFVNGALREWKSGGSPRRAGVTSLGVGGTNAHVVLEEAPPPTVSDAGRPCQLLVISAKSQTALETATQRLAEHLTANPQSNLADVAYTLAVGRKAFAHRGFMICQDKAGQASDVFRGVRPSSGAEVREAQAARQISSVLDKAQLAATEDGRPPLNRYQTSCLPIDGASLLGPSRGRMPPELAGWKPTLHSAGIVRAPKPSVVFMFPGQGCQALNMGAALYRAEPVFREELDRCAEILTPHLHLDFRRVLYPAAENAGEAETKLAQTQITQPALFAVEYALAKLWMSWGIQPEALIGHSLGEYVAACLAGVFSLNDALALVAARGRLMQELPAGAMLAISLSEDELRHRLGTGLDLAAVNGPSLCVVAGCESEVAALEKQLAADRIACRRLKTSHAFHSWMMEPMLETYALELENVSLHAPKLPVISNLTGAGLTASEATDPNYWIRHTRQTVRFLDGLQALLAAERNVFLEVGPGETLSRSVRQLRKSLHPHQPDLTTDCTDNTDATASTSAKSVKSVVKKPVQGENRGEGGFLAVASLNASAAHLGDPGETYAALGQLWIHGASVDWAKFHAKEKRRRVALPTYPFERQRYWIDPPSANLSGNGGGRSEGKKPDIADWFYLPSWKRTLPPIPREAGSPFGKSSQGSTGDPPVPPGDSPVLPNSKTRLMGDSSTWLIFADDLGFGAELAKRVSRRDETAAERAVRLELTQPGDIENLSIQPLERREPGPDEVEIQVHAAGLNFKDVLITLGMLGEPAHDAGRVPSLHEPFQFRDAGASGIANRFMGREQVRKEHEALHELGAPNSVSASLCRCETGRAGTEFGAPFKRNGNAAPLLGVECAGTIVRVGSNVKDLRVGEAVIAAGAGSFQRFVTRKANFVLPKPPAVSFEEGAALPGAFLTACYALCHVAGLRPGERILIHAASGGVGLAAIQFARQIGAEIFATVGSPEKAEFLRALGVEHIFNSRTLAFADEILPRTQGQGVDVVLNSLTGEFIEKSLSVLRRGGRFVELGKRELLAKPNLSLTPIAEGRLYAAIDMDDLCRERPALYRLLFQKLLQQIESGALQPLPVRVFAFDEARAAFRLMAQTKHLGKVVLSFQPEDKNVVTASIGPQFRQLSATRFEINPAQAADFDALLRELASTGTFPNRVVHLWTLTGQSSGNAHLDSVGPALERGFFSLLHFLQAWGKEAPNRPLEINLVSNHLHRVAGETSLEPLKATLLGAAKVIPHEFPSVTCRTIDLGLALDGLDKVPGSTNRADVKPGLPLTRPSDPLSPTGGEGWGEGERRLKSTLEITSQNNFAHDQRKILDQLVNELRAGPADEAIAYRGADRWVQTFEPVRIEKRSDPQRTLRTGGVCLITGGLGAMGLALAEHFAQSAQAKLILIGRSPFPAAAEWEEWLERHDAEDAISQKIRRIRALEPLGAECRVCSADVADFGQMREVIRRAQEQFGAIHGVVHAAGVVQDGIIQLKSRAAAEAVLHPKIRGALVLDALIPREHLDFFVLFSSVSSLLGLAGQVDYSAANAFLDAFAQQKSLVDHVRTISINWGPWSEVGMAFEAALRVRQSSGAFPARANGATHPENGTGVPHSRIAMGGQSLGEASREPFRVQRSPFDVRRSDHAVGTSNLQHRTPNIEPSATVQGPGACARRRETFPQLTLSPLPGGELETVAIYRVELDASRHWMLNEHRLRTGEAVLPGTASLELVRAAMADFTGAAAMEMRNIVFLAPLILGSGERRELQIALRDHLTEVQFEVRSQSCRNGTAGSDERLHAKGSVRTWKSQLSEMKLATDDKPTPSPPRRGATLRAPIAGSPPGRGEGVGRFLEISSPGSHNFPEILQRCQPLDGASLRSLVDDHFMLGARWANVKEIRKGSDEIAVVLELPAPFADDLQQCALHPALLDMATGHGQFLLGQVTERRQLFVPFSYQRLAFYSPLPNQFSSHIRLRRDARASAELAVFDVTLVDPEGRILVEIGGFAMKRVSDPGPPSRSRVLRDNTAHARSATETLGLLPLLPSQGREGEVQAGSLVSFHTKIHGTLANSFLPSWLEQGIKTDEGFEAFDRILSAHPGPQIVVVSQDLDTLAAQVKTQTQAPRPNPAQASAPSATPQFARPNLSTPCAAPRDDVERRVAEIWRNILGLEQVGIHDDFFELGGHSLLATQLHFRIAEAFKVELPLSTLFDAPTIAGLATIIKQHKDQPAAAPRLPVVVAEPDERHLPFPLAEIQEAYWMGRGDTHELGNVSCHSYCEVELEDAAPERLERALQKLIERHEMLRSVILPEGCQQILAEVPPYRIEVIDLRGRDTQESAAELDRIRRRMSHQVHPSDRWPLFEFRLARLDERRSQLHISIDLLIADAWSFEILFRELARLYQQPDAEWPPLELSFRDYVLAARGMESTEAYRRSREYWLQRVPQLPPAPDLPLQQSPGAIQRPRFVRREKRLDAALWQRLKARASQADLTPSGCLLAAYAEVLARWSGSARFTVNLTLFNRLPLHPQVNRLIGDFTSVTLLEVNRDPADCFEQHARRLQQQLWRDLDHRFFSGVHVAREWARNRKTRALFPVVFTSILNMNDADDQVRWTNRLGKTTFSISQTPQVYLDFQVYEDNGELVINWDAVDELFPDGLLDDMLLAYERLLRRLAVSIQLQPEQTEETETKDKRTLSSVAKPGAHHFLTKIIRPPNHSSAPPASVSSACSCWELKSCDLAASASEGKEGVTALSDPGPNPWRCEWPESARTLIPEPQLRRRAALNDTRGPIPDELLHAGFVAQARRTPQHPALITAGRTISYEELHRRALAIGRQLRTLHVEPNSLVAVVMEKGWEQVAAVLGILYSGAAYLPIDADLPEERLQYLLEHGQCRVALTQSGVNSPISWPPGLVRLAVDAIEPSSSREPLEPRQGPDDLAYVIYTSGSTGFPKGVMIDHRGALNTILDVNQRFGLSVSDRVLALSALSFDLSVFDVFGTLAAGGTIIMPEASRLRDPAHWASLVVNEKVTVWNSVPAFMGLLLDHANGYPEAVGDSLRLVLLSGDWIPVTMPERIRELVRHAQIISLGGATEASIWSILYPIDKVDPAWRSIPYGRPMRNQSFHVLNSALEPCPDWVTGQLYIGGIGLAKGYWRDTDKTRERFMVHPRNGERLYRTGDLGRYLPDSNIEFLGREDFQVKVHGNRVELGEIEAALVQHPSIAAAVVNAQGELRGPKRLVAYVVPKKRGEKSEPSDVGAAFNSFGPGLTAVGSSEAWTPDLLLLPARNEWGEDREEGKRKKDGPPLPSPLLSSQGRAGEFHACLPEIGGKYFRQFHDELDGVAANFARLERLSTAYIVRALRDLGALTERKSKHSLETTLSRFHIQPRHRKLVSQWLAALESEGLIERDGPGLYTCRSPRDSDEVGPLLDEARRQQTDWDKPMLDYLERSGENLIGLLTGNVDPLELLFPGGSWERAEAFYQENALARCFNQLLGELLGAAVQSWPAGQPLRILEIGAGTGSATSSVLPVLPADRTAYAYTDRSVFFLKGAKKKFSSYPFLTYQLLNIEEDPVAQGFATNSHDVIMATNVLHGTRSISEALQHVRSLLAPGGFVWLFEATRNLRFHLATVGFIEGFGRFEDHRKGRSGPLLSAAEWEESLRAAGFESVSAFPQPDSPANVLGHHVIVAQAAVVTSKNSISSVGRSDLQRIVPSAPGSIPAAAELSPVATTALLPLSARDEWGEDRGEGNAHKDGPPLSGPSQGREGEIQAPPIDESELRRFLRSKLPEYMVPAVFVPLEELPLSANGKVDRRLLPLPEVGSRPGQQNFVEARNAVEKVLAKVWADVFGLDRVGVHDNFFDLGGDSILNIQIVSRALGAGIQIDPRQTFQFQTIAELAEFARTAESLTQTSSRRSES